MKVLVTGGAGFIGTYTRRALEYRGYDVTVMDRRSSQTLSLKPTVLADVRDASAVDAAVADSEAVIHLAGRLGTAETVDHPQPSADTNITGTLNVLQATRSFGIPMVYISVGNWWMNNPYSITKHCAERFCLMYRKEHGHPVSVVRALNAYGPGQKAYPVRKIIPTFINACLDGDPIRVYGTGEQIMDMIHVEDVAEVLVDALQRNPGHVVEAGTGRPTTVNEIAQLVIDTVGQGELQHVPMRPGEEENSTVLADTKTLAGLRDPDTFVTLEDGLAETVNYYRSER
jgi:nucleoside-diphosphate-sugar epimerase